MSRVFYASARDGGFPEALAHADPKTRVPDRALSVMFVWSIPVFLIYYLYNVDLKTALLVSSGAAILIYVIGTAAGFRLLSKGRGRRKAFLPAISLAMSIIVMPFVGPLILISVCVALAALAYSYRFGPREFFSSGTS
jgi:amino acid transporter